MSVVLEYKCPCCGAGLQFDSQKQKMVCASCGNIFDMEAVEACNPAPEEGEDHFQWEQDSSGAGEPVEGVKVFVCPSCGGEIIGDATTAAAHCPYCDNPAVMPGQLKGEFRPDFVLPFFTSKEQAKEAFRRSCKGKLLLPKMFLTESRMERISGIYVPFWLFGCEAKGDVSYRATRVFHWSDSEYDYTKTDYFALRRAGGDDF